MRCPRCGAALAGDAAVCGRCGNPVAQWGGASSPTIPSVPSRSQAGVPVAQYDPSPYGPPVEGDRQMTPVTLMEADAETRRAIGYRPVVLPPPPPRRRSRRRRIALLALVVLVALVVATVALAHGAENLGLGTLPAGTGTVPTGAAQTATPACAARTVNPAAAKLVAHPQLTTGVRDAAKKDYRPVDNVTVFSTHQMIYLTFEIATPRAGAVSAAFCAPGLQATGRLAIPANSTGRYAEFAMAPGEANAGAATATILWNGDVAASLPFTIKP